MLDQNQAADIFARIKKHSTADEVEAIFYGGKNALTRFANNVIHQNVAEENISISVRAAFEQYVIFTVTTGSSCIFRLAAPVVAQYN